MDEAALEKLRDSIASEIAAALKSRFGDTMPTPDELAAFIMERSKRPIFEPMSVEIDPNDPTRVVVLRSIPHVEQVFDIRAVVTPSEWGQKVLQNPLIGLAASDRHENRATVTCNACGWTVSSYNANPTLVALRPEAAQEDWWVACDNADCVHAYGEGKFQEWPEWVTVMRQTDASAKEGS